MYFDIYYTIVLYINSCYGYSRLSIFLSHNVYLCFLLVFFSIFSIVNVVISVRLLIDKLVEFANK